MPLYFATTNQNKLTEAREILGVEVTGTPLEIPEIQSLDPHIVATQKAQDYFEELKHPLFIEDVSLSFTALNDLPGTYINDFSKALGNQGLCDLLTNQVDRSAVARTTLVYINSTGLQEFTGEVRGTISPAPQGDTTFGWDPIFIPEGHTKTFAQMDPSEKNQISMRRLALEKLKDFLSKQS